MNKTSVLSFVDEFRKETNRLLSDDVPLEFVLRLPRKTTRRKHTRKKSAFECYHSLQKEKEGFDIGPISRDAKKDFVEKTFALCIDSRICAGVKDDYMSKCYATIDRSEISTEDIRQYIIGKILGKGEEKETPSKNVVKARKPNMFPKVARMIPPSYIMLGNKKIDNRDLIRRIYLHYLDSISDSDTEMFHIIRNAIYTKSECIIITKTGDYILANWRKPR